MTRVVIVGAGSNLGAREASIRAARKLLDAQQGVCVRAVSPLYETDPLGPPQPRYLNAAYRLETALDPPELLRVLWQTERRLGRDRAASPRWGPRSIDLDLLWDQRGAYESQELRIPHPELEARDFALRPLLDVAPELADRYEGTLRGLASQPRLWNREAIVRMSVSAFRLQVEVEADSVAEACALGVRSAQPSGQPRASRHAVIEPTPEGLAMLLHAALQTGFRVRCATISHCSDAQWVVQLHGTSLAMPGPLDVRLWTTSGSKRSVRACFLLSEGLGEVVF